MQVRLGNQYLDLARPRVMGVLNVTPDSFSDGGDFIRRDDALRRVTSMLKEGVDIIDIGGESTRPGAAEIPVQEEMDRVLPIIEAIGGTSDVVISIDTSKAEVMREAVAAGATLINDVFALRREGALEAVRDLSAGVCLMHMLGTPGTMQDNPVYRAIPGDIMAFLEERVAACGAAGIDRDRLIIDPGFGFGKTDTHNLQLLSRLQELSALKLPVLVGISRKRTLGSLTGRGPKERVAAGVAVAVLAVERGAHIVRTHDVAATVDALRLVAATAAAGRVDD
ncbi:MAG: dihydropteroate synthase [Woeseiaceae bacterium]|nr:dihydropteroate synthase [Woeseiaceae bacterium]